MKIVGIISSGQYQGNTATLVREALNGAEQAGASVSEVYLPQYRIEFCQGCNRCMAEGKCHISDDFTKVKGLLQEADGYILSSPTYGGSANATMRNLMERLGLFEHITADVFGGKYVVGISTAASMGAVKVARSLTSLVRDSVFMRCHVSGHLGIAIRGRKITEQPAALQKSHDLGRRLALDIQKGRGYPLQHFFGRLLINMVMKRQFHRFVLKLKDGPMQALYENLSRRGLIMQ